MAEAVLESLASRLMELDGLIQERDRHVEISEEDTSNLIKNMENSNTRRKTEYDTKLFCDWLVGVDEQRRLIDIPPGELDILLSRFFMSARKADGSNYEPDSLKCIQNSLCRYLKQNNYQKNINQDIEFDHSRRVMDARRKELKQAGLGNKKQKAEAFSDEEINILYQKNLLGKGNY